MADSPGEYEFAFDLFEEKDKHISQLYGVGLGAERAEPALEGKKAHWKEDYALKRFRPWGNLGASPRLEYWRIGVVGIMGLEEHGLLRRSGASGLSAPHCVASAEQCRSRSYFGEAGTSQSRILFL
jgi:hypothetical protein